MTASKTYQALGLSFLLGLFCFIHLYFFGSWYFSLDDAYIVLHSVQALHLGFDPNYLGVSPLSGNTSPVYLSLVYFLRFLAPPIYASATASWLGIFLYAFGLLALAWRLELPFFESLLILLVGLLAGDVVFQLLNGLETGLMMAAMIWVFFLASAQKKSFILFILLGLLPFIRPELGLLSLLIFISLFLEDKKATFSRLTLVALGAAPYLFWLWWETGNFCPNTLSAKNVFFAIHYPSVLDHLNKFFFGLGIFFLKTGIFLLPFLGLLWLSRLGRYLLCFTLVLLFLYYWRAANLLLTNQCRYLFFLLPILLYSAAAALRSGPTCKIIAKACLILTAIQSVLLLPWNIETYLKERQDLRASFTDYTGWCLTHIPKNETIGIQDAGYISFATPFHLIDIVGLKTPENIRAHKKLTLPSEGALRVFAISQILKQNHIHYLIITEDWNRGIGISSGLKKLGWKVQLIKVAPYVSKKNAYLIYKLEAPQNL